MSLFGSSDKEEITPARRAQRGATETTHETSSKPVGKDRIHERYEAPVLAGGNSVASLGKSIVFKGDLTGEEDLEIEGLVEGQVKLPNHKLTIGANGRVNAQVDAKHVIVIGHVAGNVSASERVEVQASGTVDGDIRAPRLLVAEGAVVNGSIEMGSAAAGKTPEVVPSADEEQRKTG